MTETAAPPRPRRGLLPLLLGLGLALPAAGGAFWAVHSGLLLGPGAAPGPAPDALGDIAFVPLPALVVALGNEPGGRHLRLAAALEVPRAMEAEVTFLLPRVLDVLNGYLRAVEVAEFEDAAALVRLRAQMLRRIQMVAGEGRVLNLLVTEFVLN